MSPHDAARGFKELLPAPSALLEHMLQRLAAANDVAFEVTFNDGRRLRRGRGEPAFGVRGRSARAEARVVAMGYASLLESYFSGDLDIEGDLALAFRAGFAQGLDRVENPLVALRNRRHEWRFSNASHEQAKANARFHYGLGQAFYRHWLDLPSMTYTCACWSEGTTTLEQAQRQKMEQVCRKVRLAEGDRFVDIGSGWGGLLFHAWDRHRALGTGVNTCTEQVEETRAEVARRGLGAQIQLVETDFRAIPGTYDKMFSIGTLEHAGRDQLGDVVRAHAQCLKPGGLGVIHFIGHVARRDTVFYIREHIFPGGWIPSLSEALDAMEANGLEVLDVENLRRHYALTLDEWARRFDRSWPAIRAIDPLRFDERFRRTWRTYLWSCAELFRAARPQINLFQVTVSKGNVGADYPMTRAFLYAPPD
jgi:cyclopropane-fatty-acyl-phospholipid synthase